MKIEATIELNLKIKEATRAVVDAARIGLRNVVVRMASDALKGSPWLTGNNRRSLAYEVSGMGASEFLDSGAQGPVEVVKPNAIEAALYSTSGYGGFLETGTGKMAARPYFKPAYDSHKDEIVPEIRKALE